MDADKLKQLQIEPATKQRPRGLFRVIIAVVLLAVFATGYFAWSGKSDRMSSTGTVTNTAPTNASVVTSNHPAAAADAVLTASGYIINRERIEISPRFMGVVKWIGVHKGDAVTNGQVVVLLDDAEFRAQLVQAEGKLAAARAAVGKAQLTYERIADLAKKNIETKQNEDDARLDLEAARATEREAVGARDLQKTYVDWTVIRSPIDGVVLEKLVNANELVMPQSFGAVNGPSTALIAVADTKDLQVEIDVNEADLSKVFLNQKCRVSPEAYSDKTYAGHVAEIAPEASRQKGTLQVKVQIHLPDQFLTPELTAKVDFLAR